MKTAASRIKNPRFKSLETLPYGRVTSCLYIASAGSLTKIGYTENLLDRAKVLVADLEKRSGSDFHAIEAFPGSGAAYEESGLIDLMGQNFDIAFGNEYFVCTFEDARELVAQYCKNARLRRIEKKEAFLSKYIQESQEQIDELKDYANGDVSYRSTVNSDCQST